MAVAGRWWPALGAVLVVTAALAGCGGGGTETVPPPRSVSLPASPTWWQPKPGQVADWDWQIAEPYDLSAPRAMYDLDLFDLAPAGRGCGTPTAR